MPPKEVKRPIRKKKGLIGNGLSKKELDKIDKLLKKKK
jgi:hypothetical protein